MCRGNCRAVQSPTGFELRTGLLVLWVPPIECDVVYMVLLTTSLSSIGGARLPFSKHTMQTEIIALIRELWPDIKLLLLVSVFSWGISRCFLAIAMGKRMAR